MAKNDPHIRMASECTQGHLQEISHNPFRNTGHTLWPTCSLCNSDPVEIWGEIDGLGGFIHRIVYWSQIG